VKIKEVLSSEKHSPETKEKLKLIQRVKAFAELQLKLKPTKNYDTFVELDRPYVTWIVRAAPQYQLSPYEWWFPVVGSVPYKGYFNKSGAKSEASQLSQKGFDTYVRGVTAYSTLGWFDDPVLSTMLQYEPHQLVNLIIHEMVHASVFIEGHVDFNERLATFMGNIGTEIYYSQRTDGGDIIENIKNENADSRLFSRFITKQLQSLRQWYSEKKDMISQTQKTQRLIQIQEDFSQNVLPQLTEKNYQWFLDANLNNAFLLSLETYQSDLADFARLYEHLDQDFHRFMSFCKDLEDDPNPQMTVRTLAAEEN